MSIPTETIVTTLLDTTNEVKTIAVTARDESKVSIKFEGDFDSGNIEIGYLDKADGTTFRIATDGIASADGDLIYTIGRSRQVVARATGASPVINVETDIVE